MGGTPPSPSSPPDISPKSNLPMLYYGLVVVGTAAIVLAIYNLIIIRWCTQSHEESRQTRTTSSLTEMTASQRFENQRSNLLSSFKYKKEISSMAGSIQDPASTGESECAVCLSVFEDGEEVKQLPRCKHCFHATCIDTWLSSHFDCPLCRACVDPSPVCHRHTVQPVNSPENSRNGLLGGGIPV